MKKITFVILLILVSSCDPSLVGTFIYNKANGIKEPTYEEIKQNFCSGNCDREGEIELCKNPNIAQKWLRCPFPTSEKRCLKECYIPYCKCNEKLESWNYGMCKGYCEKKDEIKIWK